MTRGVVLVAYGDHVEPSLRRALTALEEVCPDLPVTVHRHQTGQGDDMRESRYAKVTLLDWTPYEHTAYLDADTQVYQPIDAGFDALADGWDMVIAPSQNQTAHDWLWHCGEADRDLTRDTLRFQTLQLQAGVFFVARTPTTQRFWQVWHEEWQRFEDQDQGAFLRALYRYPLRVWLLSRDWNGGSIVGHHWGAIRRQGA